MRKLIGLLVLLGWAGLGWTGLSRLMQPRLLSTLTNQPVFLDFHTSPKQLILKGLDISSSSTQ